MLNGLWLGFFLVAALAALGRWLIGGDPAVFAALVESLFAMAKLAVEVMIVLFGTLTLWLGFLRIAEKAGLIELLARLLGPLFRRLMAPGAGADHAQFRRQRAWSGQRRDAYRPQGDARTAGAEPAAQRGQQCADPLPGAQHLFAHAAAGIHLHVPRAAGRG